MTIQQIESRILKFFPESEVNVTDMTGTSDHIQVFIKSKVFEQKSRMQRHRMVMDIFSEELKTGEIHALTIQTET